jgi:hypothetical protein
MSDIFLEELGVPAPDHMLGVGSASHAVQTARVTERIEPVLIEERPDLVIDPGDVNSTLAATLVAVKLAIPVAHLESGLRSFDRTMPEEINRIVADEPSEYLFLHSEEAIENLRAEGIADERMHFVGNTMIDSLVAVEERFRNANAASALGVTPGDYLLVTLHRPADRKLIACAIQGASPAVHHAPTRGKGRASWCASARPAAGTMPAGAGRPCPAAEPHAGPGLAHPPAPLADTGRQSLSCAGQSKSAADSWRIVSQSSVRGFTPQSLIRFRTTSSSGTRRLATCTRPAGTPSGNLPLTCTWARGYA